MSTKERVLVRIEASGKEHFVVVVPGWSSTTKVIMQRKWVPENLAKTLTPGGHVIARVNLRAEIPSELDFSDFEEAPEPAEIEL